MYVCICRRPAPRDSAMPRHQDELPCVTRQCRDITAAPGTTSPRGTLMSAPLRSYCDITLAASFSRQVRCGMDCSNMALSAESACRLPPCCYTWEPATSLNWSSSANKEEKLYLPPLPMPPRRFELAPSAPKNGRPTLYPLLHTDIGSIELI